MAWSRFGLEDLRRTGEWHSAECVVEFGGEGRNRELDSLFRSRRGFGLETGEPLGVFMGQRMLEVKTSARVLLHVSM